ncbi:DUF3618 domain-containing protein [Actinospica sp. MGRD01-02]|uniref:DUF3618 domain-containing protein n=1 Tax=Actinospica acidithermotolerans TaxID=2828514 RepID=A0A941IP86_9ACTN|nr:DUF3618 domain-containing protein [Actinospica acidithermotolerans]MBR7830201.1 DUF3618 domain-containing protein [Actinospica acidithermotolerans]
MSRKKPGWTEPGAVDDGLANDEANETRKGTAAAHPVLSLAPAPRPVSGRVVRTGSGTLAGTDGQAGAPDNRSPAEIEADIAATRERLAGTLDELSDRLSPRGVMRQANSAVRGVFVTPEGAVRKDRAAMAAGALVAVVGGLVAARMLRR